MKELLHPTISNSFPTIIYLYVFILILQIFSIIGNGFVIFLFISSSKLRNNNSLKLVNILSLLDLLFGLLVLPYTIYHVSNCECMIEKNQLLMTVFEVPITIQYKFNLILVLSIALDRYQELFHQKYYQHRDHLLYITLTIILGIFIVLIDIILELISIPVFVGHWSASNMALSFSGILITGYVSIKIKQYYKVHDSRIESLDEERARRANHLCMKIFIIDMIFIMLPCIITSIAGNYVIPSLKNIGPFNVVCLLFVGLTSSMLYLSHKEIRSAAKSIFTGKGFKRENSINTISGPYFVS